jgi:hypothetical protein
METDHHVTYMREYVINLSNEYVDFSKQLRAFYKPKRKAKGEEGDEPEDDGGMLYDPAMSAIKMRSPGLWPLEMLSGEYTKFGLPPLPMWLAFSPEMEPSINGTFETWLIDVGGANGLPELNKACMRSFWVQVRRAYRLFGLALNGVYAGPQREQGAHLSDVGHVPEGQEAREPRAGV